ncbi:MAG: NAD-dependent epimerase/dehydratase family protein [Kiritimatiellia bacterium]
MMRVLITGGTGFFGKSILDYFSRYPGKYAFTVLSRRGLPDDFIARLARSDNHLPVEQLIGDVRTFDIGSARFDYVIHAATPARIDVPDEEIRAIILDGTANAIRQAKVCGAMRFMMVSSGGVYGRNILRPVMEEDVPEPVTVYGRAKLEAERMAVASGLPTLLPRCFSFVGGYLARNAHFAIGNFIRNAYAGEQIVIRGDGFPVRSYMYSDDLVEWLFAILERGVSGRPYNVGSDEAVSIRDLAMRVRDVLGSNNEVRVEGALVPGASNYYVPNIARCRTELGLNVKVGLVEAIRRSCFYFDPVGHEN